MTTVHATATNPSVALFDALNGAGNKSEDGKIDLQNRFLTLLTAQIRNQDPLNPLDNSQMTSQLAQISTVDGIERLNATLQALMSNSNESSAVQAAALVGHGVLVPGSGLRLDQGVALGGIELAEPADRVRVSIKDSNGLAVRTLDLGAREAGSHILRWDGKDDGGAQAADGAYSIAIEAIRGDAKVAATALELGVVSSIVRAGQSISLNVGTLGAFKLDDIRQII